MVRETGGPEMMQKQVVNEVSPAIDWLQNDVSATKLFGGLLAAAARWLLRAIASAH